MARLLQTPRLGGISAFGTALQMFSTHTNRHMEFVQMRYWRQLAQLGGARGEV